jgi:uncharacterized protein
MGESANGRTVNGLSLCILPGRLAVCRLPSNAPLPKPPADTDFWSVTRTGKELSIVLPEEAVAAGWQAEAGWRCLKVLGPLDFDLTGVLASLAAPLAEAKVPIFAISTYDTDYVLVKEKHLERARQALLANGHRVR